MFFIVWQKTHLIQRQDACIHQVCTEDPFRLKLRIREALEVTYPATVKCSQKCSSLTSFLQTEANWLGKCLVCCILTVSGRWEQHTSWLCCCEPRLQRTQREEVSTQCMESQGQSSHAGQKQVLLLQSLYSCAKGNLPVLLQDFFG